MKKIIQILIIGILVISGISVNAIFEKNEIKNNSNSIYESILLSEPEIIENDKGYFIINFEESDTNLIIDGCPMLPYINKKFIFPFGTKINDIEVSFSEIQEKKLDKKIAISPTPVTLINGIETKAYSNSDYEDIYSKNELYPKERYCYTINVGLEDNQHVIILNVQCFPLQYNPVKNLIYRAKILEMKISYKIPEKTVSFPDEYDMVIISPSKFSSDLQPLINHKNSYNIRTILKTTEEIYDEYEGRDQPEQIKYFIKNAIESWDISYVLLVGGKKSLLFGNWGIEGPKLPNDDLWYVPVRYNNMVDDTESGILSDLYYADIYKYEDDEIVFEDWDSDGNGLFAEWTLDARDSVDMYPDVFIGRLACRNNYEVRIMVDKIINYEVNGCDPSWFNKIVGVGGDSFDDTIGGTDYFEGEERNKIAAEYLGFELVKIWASQKGTGEPVPSRRDILNAINDGCGFLYFAGHGSTYLYRTYWYHDWVHKNATEPFDIYDMMLGLRNNEKLPICMIGACHNSQFNTSFFNFINSLEVYPVPECWSWVMTRKIRGGSIATIGYTGLEWVATYGWDTDDIPDCIQYFSGYMDSRFFHAYGIDGIEYLGEACGQALNDYLDRFAEVRTYWNIKTPQQWLLLGDPSLKIGGY